MSLCIHVKTEADYLYLISNLQLFDLSYSVVTKAVSVFCVHIASSVFLVVFSFISSKMINFSVPDTIDERTINKKKLTPFTIQVLKCNKIPCFSPLDTWI